MNKSFLPRALAALLLVASTTLFGFPADFLIEKWNQSKIVDNLYQSHGSNIASKPELPTFVNKASAANFSMQTGYYTGNGGTRTISGLGFQPQTVIIKADTTAGQAVWKSSTMPAANTALFSATADVATSIVTLSSNGFSVGNNANVNTSNIRYTWVAFAGSDCTATGTICVGTYTGNGTNPRKITTGFQPAFAMVKRSTAVAANFKTASMAVNMGQYYTTTAQDTAGALFTTLVSDGFNVGSINNTNAGIFYYIAFKSVSGVMAQGSYAGDGLDNKNITGFGAGSTPSFGFVKNATSVTVANRAPQMNNTESYGDYSSYMSAASANVANTIQKLQDNGLQVGTSVLVNESAQTMYWVAFGGAPAAAAGSGTFEMANGTYTGNGTSQGVSGLSFSPDLVIIKDNAANYSVFRTSLMSGNNTAYLANAAANFTTGITSINSDGFSLGASTVVNTSGNTYQWQAFGNAHKPTANSGAADFMIGTYVGNGVDSRNIAKLPFQPDMVAVKRNSTTAGAWRSSAMSGDLSGFFGALGEAGNVIQAFNSDGYQIGTAAYTNTLGSVYNWFAFKTGDNFATGTYSGTGASQNINVGFQPNSVWSKRTTAVNGVYRGSSLAGDATQYFANLSNVTARITALISNGFSVTGTSTETNASGGSYRYAAWRAPVTGMLGVDIVDSGGSSVANPGYSMTNSGFLFSCGSTSGTVGTSSQKLRITNTTGNAAWSLSIAATAGPTGLWRNGGNTQQFDYNDSTGSPSGCSDGGDSDVKAGQLTLDPSTATNTPQGGCTTSNINLGSASSFQQGTVDSINLASATAGAGTGCYWDITGIDLDQYIPGEQPSDTYTTDLTVTLIAS